MNAKELEDVTGPATLGWAQLLKDFSRRNAGRATRLEIGDDALGTQMRTLDLHLLGVVFEPRFRRVEIMLTNGDTTDRVTHSIEGVDDVTVRREPSGRDAALRVTGAGDQALLTLR